MSEIDLTKEEKFKIAKESYMKIINFIGEIESDMDVDIRVHGFSRVMIQVNGDWIYQEDIFNMNGIITQDACISALLKDQK